MKVYRDPDELIAAIDAAATAGPAPRTRPRVTLSQRNDWDEYGVTIKMRYTGATWPALEPREQIALLAEIARRLRVLADEADERRLLIAQEELAA